MTIWDSAFFLPVMKWELSRCADDHDSYLLNVPVGTPLYRRNIGEESQEYVERPITEKTLREISAITWGDHGKATGFLNKYGPWHSVFSDVFPSELGNGLAVNFKDWWVRLVEIQRALWLLEVLTSDRFDELDQHCLRQPFGSQGRMRIVEFEWPSGLDILPETHHLTTIHGFEDAVVYGWKLLAQQINLYTPSHQVLIDFDEESRSLSELPVAVSLRQIIWHRVRAKAMSARPTLRCQYSRCRRPITNATRADTRYCVGSDKCRRGGLREHGRMRNKR